MRKNNTVSNPRAPRNRVTVDLTDLNYARLSKALADPLRPERFAYGAVSALFNLLLDAHFKGLKP